MLHETFEQHAAETPAYAGFRVGVTGDDAMQSPSGTILVTGATGGDL
jgi:hypothetical protein